MDILTVQWTNSKHEAVIVNDGFIVPRLRNNRHWILVEAWVDEGNAIESELPDAPPPTNEELVGMAGPILTAFLKVYAQREGVTLTQIRDAIIARM